MKKTLPTFLEEIIDKTKKKRKERLGSRTVDLVETCQINSRVNVSTGTQSDEVNLNLNVVRLRKTTQ